MREPALGDVYAAREFIRKTVIRSPLRRSPSLSSLAGVDILLKLENEQPSGAFKLRGAANALAHLPQDVTGVVCCSSGNHGRAVAWAARERGVRAVVFMSSLVPQAKIDRIDSLGAEVRIAGATSAEAHAACTRAARSEGLHEIHPFDDPQVIAGQGTLGLEILDEVPGAATIVLPLSGGGLAAGVALAAKALRPRIDVIGVSMEHGAAMHLSLTAGRIVSVHEAPSLADALTGDIGAENRFSFSLCRKLIDRTLVVREREIYRGMQGLYFEDGIVCEGAAAVGAAALIAGKLKGGFRSPAVLVITGAHPDPSEHGRVVHGGAVRLGSMLLEGQRYETTEQGTNERTR